MKKNSFLTFLAAFIPGAGQMYLGMMKRGVILMALFAFFVFLSATFLSIFAIALPVIWCYAFFDTINAKNCTPEELHQLNEQFSFGISSGRKDSIAKLLQKRHLLIGSGLIILGVYAIFENLLRPILTEFLDIRWVNHLFYDLPTLLVSVAIIALGVYLVRGKKEKREDDYVAFKGDKNE